MRTPAEVVVGAAQAAIPTLWIGHWPKPASGATVPGLAALHSSALLLDTCLRQLVATADPAIAERASRFRPAESLHGTAAYRFLLEVATGLHSAVPGETNVFGQFKRAWESFRSGGETAAVAALAPLVGQLIHDARDIRQRHLQNIGGASYGGLVRRLIRPAQDDRILIVGAGELAAAVLRFFRGFPLGVWNRRPPPPLFAAAATIFMPDDGARAAGWATHVVMTTPADDDNDARWCRWTEGSGAGTLVHLGRRRAAPLRWPAGLRSYDLDDVFELRRAQANIRSLQIERARLACRDRARGLVEIPLPLPAQRALG